MQNLFSQNGLKIELKSNERILLYEININDEDCTGINNDHWNGSNNDNECNNNNSSANNYKIQSYSLNKCCCNQDNVVCNETYLSLTLQIFVPFVIAGFGMVGAGLLLDYVQVYFVYSI